MFLVIAIKIAIAEMEVVCKKGVLKNFAKFTGKHLDWSLFLIEFQALGLKLY